jgi:ring-1,2-phenylacetyl-CoA epoxidase subunit PaaD
MTTADRFTPVAVGDGRRLWLALSEVTDPEIDITLVDLGVLRHAEIADRTVRVWLAPTRTACPGLPEMRRRIEESVVEVMPDATVEVTRELGAWQPSDVSPHGRAVLRAAGYTVAESGVHRAVHCPYCDSADVRSEGAFGGSVCKTPFSCRDCGSTFDQLGTGSCAGCVSGPDDGVRAIPLRLRRNQCA